MLIAALANPVPAVIPPGHAGQKSGPAQVNERDSPEHGCVSGMLGENAAEENADTGQVKNEIIMTRRGSFIP